MINNICYDCQPCHRAGKSLGPNSRICNGWKDPKFVGCCALESPEEAMKRMEDEKKQLSSWSLPDPNHKTEMRLAMEKAGILSFFT